MKNIVLTSLLAASLPLPTFGAASLAGMPVPSFASPAALLGTYAALLLVALFVGEYGRTARTLRPVGSARRSPLLLPAAESFAHVAGRRATVSA
jgi:hypothetical protein